MGITLTPLEILSFASLLCRFTSRVTLTNYWVGHKVCSDFPQDGTGNPERTSWPTPYLTPQPVFFPW